MTKFQCATKHRKRLIAITAKGSAAAIVQDAAAYQRLLDIAARADVNEAVRQGLDNAASGRARPARQVFNEIRRRHVIPC